MDNKTILDQRQWPQALHDMALEELECLAGEIRQRLLDIGDQCGGHLASNLGVVELTMVLHAVFESPVDKFIWIPMEGKRGDISVS